MNLELPTRVPLPDDVRHRALGTVLAGLDEPPARRRPGRQLLAAAVAAVLVVGITVAATLAVTARPAPDLAASLPAAPYVAPLDRCRAAAPEGAGYPPAAEWETTGEIGYSVDRILFLDDRFACLVSPQAVTLSPLRGAPVGGASVVRLAPSLVLVLNPDGLPVRIVGSEVEDIAEEGVILVDEAAIGPNYRIAVGDGDAGPLPADLPEGRRVVDRPLPARPYDEFDPDSMDLESCLAAAYPAENSEPDLWLPAFRVTTPEPPVLVARIADRFAGLCVLAPDGPRFAAAERLPNREDWGQILVPSPTNPGRDRQPGDPLRILAAVPAGTTRVELTATGEDGARTVTECDLDGDLALCQTAAGPDPAAQVVAFSSSDGDGSERIITP